ncbi:MAG: HAD hydrolase family protein, partial [Oscillospiraceae bacterium]|nr:HAD hydrolase family protein [Oscillospiraceae bacterium]
IILTGRQLERVGMQGRSLPIPQIPLPLTKMIMMHPDKDYLLQVQAHMRQTVGQGYEIIFSNDFLLELTAKGSHKGGSLLWLAGRLGVRRENLYCIGDNQNDLPMLQAAHIGFAPENCSQELRAWGARIVNHCDQSCVAQVIEILEEMYRR